MLSCGLSQTPESRGRRARLQGHRELSDRPIERVEQPVQEAGKDLRLRQARLVEQRRQLLRRRGRVLARLALWTEVTNS